MSVAVDSPQAVGTEREWVSFEIHPGGADRIDAALEVIVAEAVRVAVRGEDTRWAFTRVHDTQSPHLLLRFGRPGDWAEPETDALEALLSHGLEALEREPVRELGGLLPRPPAPPVEHRAAATVRRRGAAPGEPLEPLAPAGSRLALVAVTELVDGHDRAAAALAAMAALAGASVAPAARERFWHDHGHRLAGRHEHAGRLLAGVRDKAAVLGEELRERAAALKAAGPLGAALGEYAATAWDAAHAQAAANPAALPALATRHVRETNDRLGVTMVEELLLAAILADGDYRPRPASAREPAWTPNGGRPAVELVGVSKQEADGATLASASLTAHKGEILGLLGPAEAGRSTLLQIAAGLRTPSAGSVRVLGADPVADPAAVSQRVQFAGGEDAAAEALTVRESLALVQSGPEAADSVLAATGLLEEAGTTVCELDAGRRRLLTIARALAGDPEVLVVDEPTVGVDPEAREEIWAVLRAQADADRAVLIGTASAQEAMSLCDRVGLIADGQVLEVDAPERIVAAHFPEHDVLLELAEPPDPDVLEALPEVLSYDLAPDADAIGVSVRTRQPAELVALLRLEPAFPEILRAATGEERE